MRHMTIRTLGLALSLSGLLALSQPAIAKPTISPHWTKADLQVALKDFESSLRHNPVLRARVRKHRARLSFRWSEIKNYSTERFDSVALRRDINALMAKTKVAVMAQSKAKAKATLEGLFAVHRDVEGNKELRTFLLQLRLVAKASKEVLWIDTFVRRKMLEFGPKSAKQGAGRSIMRVDLVTKTSVANRRGSFSFGDALRAVQGAKSSLHRWLAKRRGTPKVGMRQVRNRTREHINFFWVNALFEEALFASGKIRLMQNDFDTKADIWVDAWFTSETQNKGSEVLTIYRLKFGAAGKGKPWSFALEVEKLPAGK